MVDKVYLEWTPAAINSSYNLWGHLYLVKREKHTSLAMFQKIKTEIPEKSALKFRTMDDQGQVIVKEITSE